MTDEAAGARFGAGFAAVGVAANDIVDATELAVTAAVEGLPSAPDLLAVFSSGSGDALDPVGPLAQDVAQARHVLGCSAAGVCGRGDAVLGRPAVSAWAAVLPGVELRSFHLEVLQGEEGLAVVGLPPVDAAEGAALLFADPYSFPVVSFVERSREAFDRLALVGGIAGGPQGVGSTRLYLDGRTMRRGAVGLVLAGSSPGPVVVSQGCRPVGPEMVVTRAEGSVLLELAGAPALSKLREVLTGLAPNDQVRFGRGPQLGIAMDEYAEEHEFGDYLIRPVVAIDEPAQSITVGDVVEVGTSVRFQMRDAEAARLDLRERLAPAADAQGALLISCNGRGPDMFGAADSDVTLVRECLGGAPVAGMFAGGEIGPVGGRNWLHGFTASVLLFR